MNSDSSAQAAAELALVRLAKELDAAQSKFFAINGAIVQRKAELETKAKSYALYEFTLREPSPPDPEKSWQVFGWSCRLAPFMYVGSCAYMDDSNRMATEYAFYWTAGIVLLCFIISYSGKEFQESLFQQRRNEYEKQKKEANEQALKQANDKKKIHDAAVQTQLAALETELSLASQEVERIREQIRRKRKIVDA